MNRAHQPRPLVVLGLNVWMGTAAGADELQRATKRISGAESPSFRDLIHRNPPMSLRVAYCRVLSLIA